MSVPQLQTRFEEEASSNVNVDLLMRAALSAMDAGNQAEINLDEIILRAANAMPSNATEFDRGIAAGMALSYFYRVNQS